jgi:hypothetical protein
MTSNSRIYSSKFVDSGLGYTALPRTAVSLTPLYDLRSVVTLSALAKYDNDDLEKYLIWSLIGQIWYNKSSKTSSSANMKYLTRGLLLATPFSMWSPWAELRIWAQAFLYMLKFVRLVIPLCLNFHSSKLRVPTKPEC